MRWTHNFALSAEQDSDGFQCQWSFKSEPFMVAKSEPLYPSDGFVFMASFPLCVNVSETEGINHTGKPLDAIHHF